MKNKIRRIFLAAALLAAAICMSACSLGDGEMSGTKIVLTDGFKKGELFRLSSLSCMEKEYMVYLTNTQNQYESVLDEAIWEKTSGDESLERRLMDGVLSRIARVKAMNLLAAQQGVALDEEEEEEALSAAKEYFMSLNETELTLLDVSLEDIYDMYREYALAGKCYDYIIRDINPEISDDEARTITVEHILIRTYSTDGRGNRVPFTSRMKEKAFETATELLARLRGSKEKYGENGELLEEEVPPEDFDALMLAYNESEENFYTIMRGDMDKTFEEVAFSLNSGEISDIIETEDGYEIIRCISGFDQEETDRNKHRILEKRKKETFEAIYEEFVDGITKNLNEPMWDSLSLIKDPAVQTSDFFAVYEKYFVSTHLL